jgi:hypothetical protein
MLLLPKHKNDLEIHLTLVTAALVDPYQTPSGRGLGSPELEMLTITPPPCFWK